MSSLRKEITRRLLIGAALLMVLASGVLSFILHTRMLREFDRGLEARALAIVSLTSREGRFIEVDLEEESMPEIESDEREFYYQVLFEDGTLIRASEDLEGQRLPADLQIRSGFAFGNVALPEDEPGRYAQVCTLPRFDPEDELPDIQSTNSNEELEELVPIPAGLDPEEVRVVITVARSRERLDQLLLFLYATLAGLAVSLLVGLALVINYSLRRGLEPLDALNQRIQSIQPSGTVQRIDLAAPPEELRSVINALNELLDNMEIALARERRFSSAVAHELRTPVSELRMAAEAGRLWPEDSESVRRLFQDSHHIALHMERIVNQLLELTRCENRSAEVTLEEFPIDSLVQECWKRSSEVASKHSLSLDDRIDPQERVITDKAKLEIILQNLIDNAISYSVTGSVIVFSSSNSEGNFTLVIENETDNIEEADLERVWERFWRKDPARSASEHTGLGLSLVRALAGRLNIDVRIALQGTNRFQVILTFRPFDPTV